MSWSGVPRLGAALLALALTAGCGGDDAGDTAAPEGSPQASAPGESSDAAPDVPADADCGRIDAAAVAGVLGGAPRDTAAVGKGEPYPPGFEALSGPQNLPSSYNQCIFLGEGGSRVVIWTDEPDKGMYAALREAPRAGCAAPEAGLFGASSYVQLCEPEGAPAYVLHRALLSSALLQCSVSLEGQTAQALRAEVDPFCEDVVGSLGS